MRALVIFAVALVLVGCGGNLEKAVVGKWKFDIDTSSLKPEEKQAAEFGKAFLAMVTVELKDDKTMSISAMGQDQKGTWKLDGNTITINGPDGKPMVGKVIDGGDKIELTDMGTNDDMKGAKAFLVKDKGAK